MMQVAESRNSAPAAVRQRVRPAKPRSAWPFRLACCHLVVIGALGGAARLFAERWWWSTLLLYLPQAVYLLPAILTVPLALRRADGRALLASLAAVGAV